MGSAAIYEGDDVKILNMTIDDCKKCPFYRHFGRRAAPGCGHFLYSMDAFGVKELPNKNETDPYNRSTVGVFLGGVPDWCPLPDLTPNPIIHHHEI